MSNPKNKQSNQESKEEVIEVELAGFWRRAGALFFDLMFSNILTWIVAAVITIVLARMYILSQSNIVYVVTIGSSVVPLLYIIGFWIFKQATPGKILGCIRIVDARTLGKPSVAQCLIRFAGLLISTLLMGIGFILMIKDPKGQTLHDKMAKTLVIRIR